MEERSNSYTITYVMATSADEESYALESVVRGHHVYMTNWTPVIGEMLQVHCEDGNTHDRYAVATSRNKSDTYLSNFQEFRGIFCNMVAGFCVRLLGEGRGPLHC